MTERKKKIEKLLELSWPTLFWPKMPRSPDLFLILPPVIVPSMEVFFSEGVLCGVVVLLFPDPLSTVDRSSKGISPGGRNPLLYFSTTSKESWSYKIVPYL